MTPLPSFLLRLHPDDDVAIARADLPAGLVVTDAPVADGGPLTVRQDIPQGHKVALQERETGAVVRRYGEVIGIATAPIVPGDHVHSHNLGMADFSRETATPAPQPPRSLTRPPAEQARFLGYRRADGRVATRNYLAVLSTVNCSAAVSRAIAAAFSREGRLRAHPRIDGVIALTHPSGCAMAADGLGLRLLQRTLRGYAIHPNIAGVLLVGLGCEVNRIAAFADLADAKGALFQSLAIQDAGGSRAAVAAGIAALEAMLPLADPGPRQSLPAAELVIGLQCGGSDGYSGISANPALGMACDRLVQEGGTVVLSETPEIYGAEHLLTRRAVTPAVAERLLERIRWWETYTRQHGGSLDANPSPGNKAGGLTTILEKSLGAAIKGGSSALSAVYQYAEPITSRGLVFMDTPGYDPCSATGQIAGGCTLVAFTTGRGSVSGFKPAPCLKLASNSTLFSRMPDDMDINCGGILDGEESVAACGERIFARLLALASGQPSRSESLDFGDQEFVPWIPDAVL